MSVLRCVLFYEAANKQKSQGPGVGGIFSHAISFRLRPGMPTLPYTAMELGDAELMVQLAGSISDDSSGDEETVDTLILSACDPLLRKLKQEIGPERLSLQRLQREAAASGLDAETASHNIYTDYRFRLEHLPRVVAVLNPPPGFRTHSGAVFTGEEGVLLLLRRFRSTGPLMDLTKEVSRTTPQISEAVRFMVEHVHQHFPYLIDVRSFTAWEQRFDDFAEAFVAKGSPIDNLCAFIDGKLQPVCRPGRYQHVLYSGHRRIHGLKTQGLVFPNGIQPFPYGPINGSRHDSFVLSSSGIVRELRGACQRLGSRFVLFGDSAYPISRFLFRMFKGVMTPAEVCVRDCNPNPNPNPNHELCRQLCW